MNLSATMDLKAGAFLGPLQQVRGSLSGTVSALRGILPLVTGLGGAFAAFKSAHAIVENFLGTFEKGHELEKFSRITGQTVSDLVVLQKALKVAGLDEGGLPHMLVMLQKSLGGVNEQGEPTKHIFDQLGLSVEKLQKLGAPAQLEAIGAKIRALPNAAQRSATAMAIFGRNGAEMLAVLDDPNALKDAMAGARGLGDLYQRNAKIFADITRTMGAIKGKISGLFAGLAEGAAPAFKAILDWVKKIPLAEIGAKIGSIFTALTQAFREGKLGELVSLSLQVGFSEAANSLSQIMAGLAGGIATLFSTLPDLLFEALSALTSLSFWKGVAQMALGAFQTLGAALLHLFMQPLTYLQAGMDTLVGKLYEGLGRIPKVGDMLGLKGFKSASFDENLADRKKNGFFFKDAADFSANAGAENVVAGGELLKDALRGSGKALSAVLDQFTKSFTEGFSGGKLIDTTALRKKLEDLFGSLLKTAPKAAEKLGDASAGLLGGRLAKIDGDRLSKVGGFIGGAGGPALDYARRTAVAVEKIASRNRAIEEGIHNRNAGIDAGLHARGALWV